MDADLIEWGTDDTPRRSLADRLMPGSRRQAHRYAAGLFAGAVLLAVAAELLPWMTITVPAAVLDPSGLNFTDQASVTRLAGSYDLAQMSLIQSLAYSLTWVFLAVLAGAALSAASAARRVLSTAAVGAGFGQLLVLAMIFVAARNGGDVIAPYRVVLSTTRVSAGPDIGLYCAFGALVLAVAGVVVTGVRDWRGLAADSGPRGAGTGAYPALAAAGGAGAASVPPLPRDARAELAADLPPGQPWPAAAGTVPAWDDRRAEDWRAEDRRGDDRRAEDWRGDDRRAEDWRGDDRRAEDRRGGRGGDAGVDDGTGSGFSHGIVVAPIDPFLPPPGGRR